MHQPFVGHLTHNGRLLLPAGFMDPASPMIQAPAKRSNLELPELSPDLLARIEGLAANQGTIERAEGETIVTGEIGEILKSMAMDNASLQRAITSAISAFPVRENLEAPARVLIPLDTPLRNRIRRVPGAGLASAWKQISSLGGGWGVSTTVTSGASSATQTVGSTAGMTAGDTLYFATTAVAVVIASVTNATTVVLATSISTTTSEVVTKVGMQPGGGGAIRTFFAETGAPADHTTTYANKSASYKLLGTYASIKIGRAHV